VPFDTLKARTIREQERNHRRAAEDRGNQYLGGTSSGDRWYFAEVTGGGFADPWKPRMLDTLIVLGESFVIPMRDTMVIVMVDGTEGGEVPPRLVGSVRVPTITVTSTHKTWRSGDTTFIVRPPRESRRELETFLRAIPEVYTFLGREP
jgi:hypothetical protein